MQLTSYVSKIVLHFSLAWSCNLLKNMRDTSALSIYLCSKVALVSLIMTCRIYSSKFIKPFVQNNPLQYNHLKNEVLSKRSTKTKGIFIEESIEKTILELTKMMVTQLKNYHIFVDKYIAAVESYSRIYDAVIIIICIVSLLMSSIKSFQSEYFNFKLNLTKKRLTYPTFWLTIT